MAVALAYRFCGALEIPYSRALESSREEGGGGLLTLLLLSRSLDGMVLQHGGGVTRTAALFMLSPEIS